MPLSQNTLHAIVIGASIALTPVLMRVLSKMAPPRVTVAEDGDSLKTRYGKLEIASQLAFFVGMFGAIGICAALHKNSLWMVGLLFGSVVATPVSLIALFTLPKGLKDWNGFWQYYELKYRVGLGLVFPFYGFLIVLGLVSAIMLFA